MHELGDLTERLVAAVVTADADDLPGLAAMHGQCQAIAQEALKAADLDKRLAAGVSHAAGDAEKLLERIILREVTDVTAAMQTVSQSVAALQKLVQDGVAGESSGATAAEAAPAAPQTGAAAPQERRPPEAPAAPGGAADPSFAIEDETALNPDDLPLVTEFIGEANSHIESAEAELLKLEDDPSNLDIVNAIFRSFHTIKGVAGFLNLKQIGKLSHAAENLLDLGRKGQLQLVGTTVDVVLESIDSMKSLVGALDGAVKSGKPIEKQAGLSALLKRLHDCATGRPAEVQKSEGKDQKAEEPDKETRGQADTPAPGQEEAGPKVQEQHKAAKQAVAEQAAKKPTAGDAGGEATVKVATDRLDSLINTVGELVIAQLMVSQDVTAKGQADQRLARNMAHLGKITRELQDLSMSMRMVPIQGVFQKMARLVRDLGRKACKEVEFVQVGGETELDRNVVEAIGDPLVHMVRNSVDHGLESPDDRVAAGKPRAGRVQLKAYHQAGNIVIEVSDDGKGLNKKKILAKAIAAGLVKEGQEVSDQEIFRLIFHAGLSTADKVTDISGRGVGMDVVRKNVEALRGRIDIASTEGKGSTFTVRLPLTLAVIDGLVVNVGEERYILPILSIEQSIQPKEGQISTVAGRAENCMVRGMLLPMVRLHRLFGVKPRTEDPTQALVVIVQDNHRRCCLLVDALLGQQQVVIKSLGDGVGKVRGVSGGAILGDGNISLILDVPGLIDLAAHG